MVWHRSPRVLGLEVGGALIFLKLDWSSLEEMDADVHHRSRNDNIPYTSGAFAEPRIRCQLEFRIQKMNETYQHANRERVFAGNYCAKPIASTADLRTRMILSQFLSVSLRANIVYFLFLSLPASV